MVQTWKSQTGGADANLEVDDRRCDANPIAVQWAAIATKLESLASLKEDVAILAQMLGYEQIEEKTRNQPIHFRSRSYNPSPAAESVEKDDGQTPQYNDVMLDPIAKDDPLQGNGFSREWDMMVGCAIGYTLEDYAAAIVQAVKFVCNRKSVKHPVICSKSVRAIVSHHPILMLMVGCAQREIRGIVGGKSRYGEAVNVDSNRTLLFNKIKACLWVWIMPTCFWLLDLHFGPSSIFGQLPSDRPTTVGPLFEQKSDSARANTQQPWIGFANNRHEDKSSFGARSIDTILPLGSRLIGKQGGGN